MHIFRSWAAVCLKIKDIVFQHIRMGVHTHKSKVPQDRYIVKKWYIIYFLYPHQRWSILSPFFSLMSWAFKQNFCKPCNFIQRTNVFQRIAFDTAKDFTTLFMNKGVLRRRGEWSIQTTSTWRTLSLGFGEGPSHNSKKSFLIQEMATTGPNVEGTCRYH